MKRGQAATEFFLYLTVFLFVVIVAFVTVNYMQSTEIPIQKNKVAKETGAAFADVLSLAVRAGPGFTYKYYFPRTIFGSPYIMKFFADHMTMEWKSEYGSFDYYYSIPPYGYQYGSCLEGGVLLSNTTCGNAFVLNHTTEGVLIISVERW
ncbi:MAG: hypothetical protein QXT45_04475 [Candidatus Bilamarchaeaceae archaeon]